MSNEQLTELGFYVLAGHSDSPADALVEARRGEELGLGAAFISERFSTKDAAVLSGGVGGVTSRIGIATAATNPNTRHPLVTATIATTMHRMTGGRFALGLGRGIDALVRAIGLQPVTSAEIEDTTALLHRLWAGDVVLGHDGPVGRFPYLHQDATFDESIPLMLVALGERTLELAGRCMDGVVLHTYFGERALASSVAAVRRGAEESGRDPDSVRVWSVVATVGDHLAEEVRLRKTVGRLASYLQGYGDLLVGVNAWDPTVLEQFRADPVIGEFTGAIDARATTQQLEHIATLLPDEWLAEAATGSPEECARAIADELQRGADSVILHGSTPDELEPVVHAYREIRSQEYADRPLPANPGWS